jgi:hypothetical protein
MVIKIIALVVIVFVLISCMGTKNLVYRDEWEGDYILREYNSCCDSATRVRLVLSREMTDRYTWKIFFNDQSNQDTIYGKAEYVKKQLKFFVSNPEETGRYFKQVIKSSDPVFRMEQDGYYSKGEVRYGYYYTRWYNDLIGYQQGKMLFAGVSYHFEKNKR